MSACSGTVLPLSFTEKIRTLEGFSEAENSNAKGLISSNHQISKGKTCKGEGEYCGAAVESSAFSVRPLSPSLASGFKSWVRFEPLGLRVWRFLEPSSSSVFPVISLGFTILGGNFAYVTVS